MFWLRLFPTGARRDQHEPLCISSLTASHVEPRARARIPRIHLSCKKQPAQLRSYGSSVCTFTAGRQSITSRSEQVPSRVGRATCEHLPPLPGTMRTATTRKGDENARKRAGARWPLLWLRGALRLAGTAMLLQAASFALSSSSSTTLGSARVEVSPNSSLSVVPAAILRRIRRMILPERVLGNPGAH